MDIVDIHVDIRWSESAEISRSLMPVKYSDINNSSSVVMPTEWKHTDWIYFQLWKTYGICRVEVMNFDIHHRSNKMKICHDEY